MIIKIILNMYNLLSKFYWREREIACDGELKNTSPKYINPKQSLTNHNDSSIQIRVVRKNKKLRERE